MPSSATFAENGKGNLQDNKNSFSGEIPAKKVESVLSTASARKAEENSAHLKDVQKKAKQHSLMQEVATFLTFHDHFCFNVLTEVTEVACLENDVPDPHLHYAKVLQTRTRRGVFRLCFRFAMVEDDLQKVLTFSVPQLFGRMKSIHPSVIRSMTAYSLSRILPLLGGCILPKGMYIG